MEVLGMDAERLARISDLVAECRPVHASAGGMDAVQELLSARGVPVMDSILVTRKLLGDVPHALGEAKWLVLGAPSRSEEREAHRRLTEGLYEAVCALYEEEREKLPD
ncbi:MULTISPECIES: hypothetical protein [Streptomyces]|uniref:hypothetical protein n=1 Tax=Streptomyces TaxID=1883 RepID=UPI00131A4A42|nr:MULTISPECIES: hypothetical protein [Streptomyces]